MKKILLIIVTLLLSVGIVLTGCSKHAPLKKADIPNNTHMHTYQPKNANNIKSFNAVPIKDDKYGTLKPRGINVYLEKGNKASDITKFGEYQSSDKKTFVCKLDG